MDRTSPGQSIAAAAMTGLLAGLPACSGSQQVDEVVVNPALLSQTLSTGAATGSRPTTDSEPAPSPTPDLAATVPTDSASPPDTTPQVVAETSGTEATEVVAKPPPKPKKPPKPKRAALPPDPKDCCAGKNACKGLGGCKTANNACMGKNDCKGQGGCRMGRCP